MASKKTKPVVLRVPKSMDEDTLALLAFALKNLNTPMFEGSLDKVLALSRLKATEQNITSVKNVMRTDNKKLNDTVNRRINPDFAKIIDNLNYRDDDFMSWC